MQAKTITGYCDPFSAMPGQTLRFMISTYAPGDYRAELVRIRGGDDHAQNTEPGVGVIEEVVGSPFAGTWPGRTQPVHPGSYGIVADAPALEGLSAFTIAAWIWPTLPGGREQAILSFGGPDGPVLMLDATGALSLAFGDMLVSTGIPLRAREWVLVSGAVDPASGMAYLSQIPTPQGPGQRIGSSPVSAAERLPDTLPVTAEAPALIAARMGEDGVTDHFNGKIDSPCILGPDDTVIAQWDLGHEPGGDVFTDNGPDAMHGLLVNLPARAMTGHAWDGTSYDWRQCPEHYSAVHFHDDDLIDAGWEPDFSFTIPDELPSGLYAVKLVHGDSVDRIPFVVRPPAGTATAPVALLLPTASYLAYANQRLRLKKANPIFGDALPTCINDAFLVAHPEFGNSTYDTHTDFSGVHVSSRLRPVTNMKPGDNRPWGLPADCNILAWLAHLGQDCDIVTDEDLHREGAALLAPYRCVMTGSHPEYHSTAMLDALEQWLGEGGRLMYLGGNGFYWRVAFRDDLPGVLEVRRAEDGTRAWMAEPGEYHHAFTGEYGGLWRRIGRAPNRLVGVGFAAQGFAESSHYVRKPGADNPRAAFIMKGVPEEIIGDFGSVGGGAAGEEIDRHDVRLGSPRHALVLASSTGHGPDMLRTKEELLSTVPYFEDPKVRADLTFFECDGGGAVFSTGSIAWVSSLAHNDYDNPVARITGNVLRRFIADAPFEMPDPG
ncbi:MAG: N,N-dimethylformamidase beta subunit family domain-containing protein [Pseudomonadota bacterium]|nr:N,N-dimethylformamidase beta subunit family domain-containing protein [Pseudomonadota bacterium]